MTDLAKLVDQFVPSGGPRDGQELGTFPTDDSRQDTEKIDISHISQFPTGKQERYRSYNCDLNFVSDDAGADVTRDEHACGVGNVGKAGKPNENNDIPFPIIERELGKWEKEGGAPAGASPDPSSPPFLNHAAPQRSDWWTGPAMAEVDALTPPAGSQLPISAAEVRAGVARELRHLASLGVIGRAAERRAVAIVRAKIGNSPALAERQANTGRCHVCGEWLRDDAPVIAVLSGAPDRQLHLHHGCHDAYRVRRRALTEGIMAEAGYNAEEAR